MAMDMRDRVLQHASGRPGPNVVTGEYRDSIQISDTKADKTSATNVVSTGAPQALRLENGFVGVDRAGRHYNQPAFPHWRPALAEMHDRRSIFEKMLVKSTMEQL
jgi:hypothetical protein